MHFIDRRVFFRRSAVAAAGFAAAPLLAPFFAQQDPQQEPRQGSKPPTREEQLRAALQRAKEHGKPLLVLVVPDEPLTAYERGLHFGALLNHGGQPLLLELALCVPACASVADVQRVTGTREIAGQPLMLLVDTGSSAGRLPVASIDVVVDAPTDNFPGVHSYDECLRLERKCVEGNNEKLLTGLRGALHEGGDSLARLAARIQAQLTGAQQDALAGWFRGGAVPDDELLVRATATVRDFAARQPDEPRAAMLAVLAGAIERVVIKKRVPGSKWGNTSGCGVSIEQPDPDDEVTHFRCGMGHVPDLSRRFLQFLTGS